MAEAGRFAVVTNVAGYARREGAPSRGDLVADFLRDGTVPRDEMLGAYGGFSLITLGAAAADYRTNQPAPAHHLLAPGLHGISNGPLDPPWPRTRTLTDGLEDWLTAGQPIDALLDLLADEQPAVAGERPVFIRDPVYGTRCSTVVAVDAAGRGEIVERRFGPSGQAEGETRLPFAWPARG